MNATDFLELILSGNPLTAPVAPIAPILLGGNKEKDVLGKPTSSKPSANQTPPPPTSTSSESKADNSPKQQPIPPGGASGADLPALIEALMKLQAQEAQATRAAQQAEAQAAREFYPEQARIDIETYRQQSDIAAQAGMEKMRENTARQIELQTIDAWQKITQAQINRDTAMGLGMMNLAYAAGVPNPNVLQAGASLAGQGRSGFGMPSSVIS